MEAPREQDTPPMDKYWSEVSDLTVFEAAFWMEIEYDPRWHSARCDQDDDYQNNFDDHPGGAEAVSVKCEVIKSAIRAGLIKITKEIRSKNGAFTTRDTLILKSDWLNWCRQNGYAELANRFEPNKESEYTLKTDEPLATSAAQTTQLDENDWKAQAKAIADECFDSDTTNNCRDSLKGYSRRVMETMQERGIRGPRGIIDNANTVMREALQGKKWWMDKSK